MQKEYDFSKGKRGPIIKPVGKTRITIHIDTDVINEFRDRSDKAGHGYQTMINKALRQFLGKSPEPIDEKTLRKVLREELARAG